MKLKNNLLASILLLSTSALASDPIIKWKMPRHQVISKYLEMHKDFSNKLCRGADHKYDELYRNYRGAGYFIPIINETSLDKEAISQNIGLIVEKINWLEQEIKKVQKLTDLKHLKGLHENMDAVFKELMTVKQKYHEDKGNKTELLNQGRLAVEKLKKLFHQFNDQASYLLPFGHPNDYFGLRRDYDFYKNQTETEAIKKKNSIYFQRKVYEDGSQLANHTRSDRFFRALLSTVELALLQQDGVITEDFRYDLNSFLGSLERYAKKPKKEMIERLTEWKERSQETFEFYQKLLNEDNATYADEIVRNKSESQVAIKDFTLKKQADVYDFWKDKPELYRALFSIETILFNEAGAIDGRDALERHDVTQVVINRMKIPFYREITEDDSIHPYLSNLSEEKLKSLKWLNVMFKEGEFSFTYYFISASKNIYCPDMSRMGKFLRKENLKIGLKMLKNPQDAFDALRYFSRASMLGRIDMAKIWDNFEQLPERAGLLTYQNAILGKKYDQGKYQYLYTFKDRDNIKYQVLEINEKPYVMRKNFKGQYLFYKYRNPHYFSYFRRK